jgi:hypothetical protein
VGFNSFHEVQVLDDLTYRVKKMMLSTNDLRKRYRELNAPKTTWAPSNQEVVTVVMKN